MQHQWLTRSVCYQCMKLAKHLFELASRFGIGRSVDPFPAVQIVGPNRKLEALHQPVVASARHCSANQGRQARGLDAANHCQRTIFDMNDAAADAIVGESPVTVKRLKVE